MLTSLTILDVGKGDSLVLFIKNKSINDCIVIDCHQPTKIGHNPTIELIKTNNISNIDTVCLTHPDIDHFSGMEELLNYCVDNGVKIGKVIVPVIDHIYYRLYNVSERIEKKLKELYKTILNLTKKGEIEFDIAGYNKIIYERDGLKLTALGPLGKDLQKYITQTNNYFNPHKKTGKTIDKNLLSIILLLETNYSNSLLCSDASKTSIENCLRKYIGNRKKKNNDEFKFTTIKVAHHGSKNNNCDYLWENYIYNNITNAIISCGQEWPHAECVNMIIKNDCNIYATRKTGCLKKKTVEDFEEFETIENEDNESKYHGNIKMEDGIEQGKIIPEIDKPPITSFPL